MSYCILGTLIDSTLQVLALTVGCVLRAGVPCHCCLHQHIYRLSRLWAALEYDQRREPQTYQPQHHRWSGFRTLSNFDQQNFLRHHLAPNLHQCVDAILSRLRHRHHQRHHELGLDFWSGQVFTSRESVRQEGARNLLGSNKTLDIPTFCRLYVFKGKATKAIDHAANSLRLLGYSRFCACIASVGNSHAYDNETTRTTWSCRCYESGCYVSFTFP